MSNGSFPVTQWSLVARAGNVDAAVKRQALTDLLTRYQPALRAYLLYRKRINPDEAEDVLQEFMVSKVMEQGIIERAEKERGKFRSFLLTALDRFIVSRIRYNKAQKRSAPTASLDDDAESGSVGAAAMAVDADAPSPTSTFDVAWAQQIVRQAVERMRGECAESSRPDVWLVFETRIYGPAFEGSEPVDYEQLVKRGSFRSPRDAANVLITAKRMFVRNLRTVIGEYEPDEAQVDAEMRDLQQILGGC